ncbi:MULTISPECIES: BtpA/SgcQ family protein [unclassified Acidisoma]|jgi:membrane complex biogenesis BtpA family protein|uniref:BtpA/SgcQ family protein n=1 Tax=unclassified Acidisoma TaxID=2634065 RepID=UPI00131B019C|nr:MULTISPECIES: BtpA/SgcQ family protein [unclassified Acidisoma]
MFDFFEGTKKVVIGMIHIGALPGTPLYDERGGMRALIDGAMADLEALQAGGVDAVMFGNENDRPYSLKAPVASIAAMSAVVTSVKPAIDRPFGVNYLWDPVASVAIAAATGARFVREIFTGVYASDMGLWVPDCDGALRARRDLGVRDLKLLFNINAEFAAPLDTRPLGLRARSAVFSSLADAILVSGPITGQATEQSDLNAVCAVVKDVPVLANTGVNIGNVADILSVADGCVVGTHFKVDGHTWNAVDTTRVKRFMDLVGTLRA